MSYISTPSIIIWGEEGTVTKNNTWFMRFGNGVSSTTEVRLPISSNCLMRNLRIRAVSGSGAAVVFTVRKNGADTAITATVAASGTTGSDLTNVVSLVAGDDISLKIVTGNSNTLIGDIVVSLEVG